MVQLVILAHELSPLEGKPDQYTGFPTGVKNKRLGGALQNVIGGLQSIHGGGGVGGFQEKGKYLVNICTVACKLKNVIFLLN